MHSLPHLHGAKRTRRKPEEIRALKVARASREDDMPLPSVHAMPTRKRAGPVAHADAASSHGIAISAAVGTRKLLNLPLCLAEKFPHLAEVRQP